MKKIFFTIILFFLFIISSNDVLAYDFENVLTLYSETFVGYDTLNDRDDWYMGTPALDYWFDMVGGILEISADGPNTIHIDYEDSDDWLYNRVLLQFDYKFSDLFLTTDQDTRIYFSDDGDYLMLNGDGTNNRLTLRLDETNYTTDIGSDTNWHTLKLYVDKTLEYLWVYNDNELLYFFDDILFSDQTWNGLNFWVANATTYGKTVYMDNLLLSTFVHSLMDEWYTITIFDDPRDYETGIDIPDKKICYFDETCTLSFWYDSTLIGGIAYLVPNIDGQQTPDYAISSTTLIQNIFLESYLDLPTESEATTTEYCIYVDRDEPLLKCYTVVEYIDDTLLPDFSEYDIESVCDDIPLEDPPSYWSDFSYGIECGFRKLSYWLLTPRPASYIKLEGAISRINTSFPFSIYNQIKDTFSEITISTSSQSIPFFWAGETLEDVHLLDENSMTDGLFGSAWTIIDNAITKLIYFACFIYFIYRIFKLSHRR